MTPFRLLSACLLVFAGGAGAHDIPSDITVQSFVHPAGRHLQLLVRVPLKAIRDLDFPEQKDGYLDVEGLAPRLGDAAKVWIAGLVEIEEGGEPLAQPSIEASRLSLESDRSFASLREALAHLGAARLGNADRVMWDQVLLDVLLDYRIRSEHSDFSIHPRFERLAERVVTVVRFLPPGGAVRAYEFVGDPGMVHLDPRWYQAALRFVDLGFFHILDGTDHLLFLFCLVIPFRRLRPLLVVVTAFTLAHSMTLIASAFQLAPDALWFPPLVETLIAASIVYMALENIAGAGGAHRRWMIAFGFGLVHGFGFSFALRETLQFAGSHLLSSLLAFNLGVELGQILVLGLLVPALGLLFRFVVAERMGTIILSVIVAHTGWHWMTDRWETLRRFPIGWPLATAASIALALRWLAAVVVLAGVAWWIARILRRETATQPGARQADPVSE